MNSYGRLWGMPAWVAVAIGTLVLCAGPVRTLAQSDESTDKLTVHLSDPSRPGTIKASLVNGGITVNSYDGKDILIEARARNPWPAPPAYGGMHRVMTRGSGLTAEEENNDVQVSVDSVFHTVDLVFTVPAHTSVVLRTVNDGNITVNGVDGDLDVSVVNGGITLDNVSGNAVAHTLNGRLLAKFVKVNPQKAMAFSSLNGEIDVTFPADLKASLSLHVNRGDVYSDFDVQVERSVGQPIVEGAGGYGSRYRVRPDGAVYASINGGGAAIQLSSWNGNIFIRKAGGAH
ncbi:MAG TPA: hypothetical protein VEJ46_15565 [Candidatus Acidoferrum sp.]|nr:hypothetical protein [Candidatus Acidoferrum sp.]